MSDSIKALFHKIDEYKGKYYKNLLIKGVIFTAALVFSAFLILNVIEYFGRFNSFIRGTLFFSFIGLAVYSLFFWVLKPIAYLFHFNEPLNHESAAKEIGKFFPEIGDRLLNTLQLSQLSDKDNSLLQASIEQKSKDLRFYKFADAIKINDNKKYLKYALPPLALILLIAAISPKFFKSNTERIVYFQKEFAEEAPFKFKIKNNELKAVKNEDFILNLSLIGNTIPESVFLVANDRKFKMESTDGKNYTYTFSKVQNSLDFHFLASGFTSNEFELELISRPNLLSFDVSLTYPNYLNKSSENFDNVGNLVIPEGTIIQWNFKAVDTDSLLLAFEGEKSQLAKDGFGDNFSFTRRIKNSSSYKILLKNTFSANRENIEYYINVVPDKYPQIQMEQIKDTTLYNYVVLGGNISDDYGLSQFKLFYKTNRGQKENLAFSSIDIPFNKSQVSQSFYYQLPLSDLKLNPGDKVEYYLQLWDNDGVNGSKSTKTPSMTFSLPSAKNYDAEIEKEAEKTENMLEKLIEKSAKLKNQINDLENRLRSKKELDFQEKKQMEELLKKREELMNDIKQLQQQFQQMQEKTNRFQEQSPELQKKMEQLEKLVKDLVNDESTKMLEELKKMLEKGMDDKTIEQLEKIKNKERNLDKDIDRTLKLLKQLQLEQKIEKEADNLEKLAEKQEKLAEQTEKNEKNQNQQQKDAKSEELKKEQEKVSKEFEEEKQKLNDIEKLSKELKKDIDTEKEQQEEISNDQKNAEKQLEQKQNDSASKNQKKASKKMKSMAFGMKESLKKKKSAQMDEDLNALREILENLVTLSFDQEKLMKDFRNMSVSDPRFVPLSQQQLKIQDDAKIVEDSLYSLAKRVMQIQSFITREVTTMKNSMDESVKYIRQRKLNIASAKQQFSMTSINNLALMLSNIFVDMQAMSSSGSGKPSKNKSKGILPNMSEMQMQMGEKMGELGKTQGKGSRQLSEELGKLAQEQARVRKMIQEMQEDLKGTELGKKIGNDLKDMEKKADEIETELVNKRISPDLIKRSRELQTRLLEAEKAKEQQDEDPTRQSKTGLNFNRQSPPSMEKYLQEKQKQVELIRTVPPNYTPFYKKQTDSYFNKIK
jgi:hypothetical protein